MGEEIFAFWTSFGQINLQIMRCLYECQKETRSNNQWLNTSIRVLRRLSSARIRPLLLPALVAMPTRAAAWCARLEAAATGAVPWRAVRGSRWRPLRRRARWRRVVIGWLGWRTAAAMFVGGVSVVHGAPGGRVGADHDVTVFWRRDGSIWLRWSDSHWLHTYQPIKVEFWVHYDVFINIVIMHTEF